MGIVLGKIVDIEPFIGRAATVKDVAKLVKVGRNRTNVGFKRDVIEIPPNGPQNETRISPLSNLSRNPSKTSSTSPLQPPFIGLNGQKHESARN